MNGRVITVVLLLLGVGCAGSAVAQDPQGGPMDPWPELQALQEARGDAYTQLRDEALAGLKPAGGLAGAVGGAESDGVLRARAYAEHADALPAAHARILLGWHTHRELYAQVLNEVEAVDYDFERQTMGGIARVWDDFAARARDTWKAAILPLCWEVLLKRQDSWPSWKVITFLRMLDAVPDARSRPVVAWLAEHGVEDLRQDAREVLAGLPAEQSAEAR